MLAKHVYRFVIAAILGLTLCSYATLEQKFKLKLISGVFATSSNDTNSDGNSIRGAVVPWRLAGNANIYIDKKSEVGLDLVTESSIKTGSGPYIAPFSTGDPKSLSLGRISYTYILDKATRAQAAVGKVKANILKKGNNLSPFPFSDAVSKPAITNADLAVALQTSLLSEHHFIAVGVGIDKISSGSSSANRTHSLFLESYYNLNDTELWLHYSRNNLGQTYAQPQYGLVGFNNKSINRLTLSSSVAFNNADGLVGVDVGSSIKLPFISESSSFGLAYAFKRDKNKTLEVSYKQNISSYLNMVAAMYYQKPIKTSSTIQSTNGYYVGGLRLEQVLIK